MSPEFRQNESYESPTERAYESWLARVRATYGEDFGYMTAKEGTASDLFLAGWTVLAATHEIELEFGEPA